jgi:hypothetical protein
MDEIQRRKLEYARQIEDGRKIEAFTSMPEWNWYVTFVVEPTIMEYTNKIMHGEFKTDKEDWIMRGMVQALQMLVDVPKSFIDTGMEAKAKAKGLQDFLDADG